MAGREASYKWQRVKGSFSERFTKTGTFLAPPATDMEKSDVYRSEEDLLADGETDSFWDIGNYKRVVKRVDDGARLCGDFVKMAQERADIEAKYSKHLSQWARKWEELLSKGPEYGSLEVSWKAVTTEASKLSDVHGQIHRQIQDEIVDGMQEWKSQHYRKHLIHFKESKKAEDGFAQAQKPWAKHLIKNRKAKKAFHLAARELEVQTSSIQQIEHSRECTSEQVAKGREKKERAQKELDKALAKYKERLSDLQHYQGRYVEDMNAQFAKCQEFERKRKEQFRTTLQRMRKLADLSQDQSLADIYTELGEMLSRTTIEEDLRVYSGSYGADMSYGWPEFEQYVPGQSSMSKLGTLRSPLVRNESPMLNGGTRSGRGYMGGSRELSYEDSFDVEDDWMEPPPSNVAVGLDGGSHGDEDTSTSSPSAADTRSRSRSRSSSAEPQGRLMRAVYDYVGPEEDDLSFKEGELVRVMYEGEDGWAEGMLGEQYGYVPISYLEPV